VTRAARFAQYTAWHLLWLGEGYTRAGEHTRAEQTLQELLEVAKDWGMQFILGSAHRILGEIAMAANPRPSATSLAATHFERASALLGEIEAENELALACAGSGRSWRPSSPDLTSPNQRLSSTPGWPAGAPSSARRPSARGRDHFAKVVGPSQ
jgi:hypothetical protein